MKIIVGLGNPLSKYKNTRHNVGEAVASRFQEINSFPKFQLKKKLESLISEGKIGEEKIILALPQTFMNESGRAVRKLITNYKLPITKLLVVHDDLDLPLGKIRIKKDGSSGGHNGVQSIIDHLKTEDFIRIKIGIMPLLEKIRMGAFGLPKPEGRRRAIRVQKFVLEKFGKEEKELMDRVIKRGTEIICDVLNKDTRSQTFSI